jgi:septum formation protein
MTQPLILASTSRYRKLLLQRLNLPFEVCAPRCDEQALKDPKLEPGALARMLAEAKARSIAEERPEAFVIGSDQVVDVDGELLSKPGTPVKAEAQLARLSGKRHRLSTAVTLLCPGGKAVHHVDCTLLDMRSLNSREISRYVAQDRPLDCAGSYKIECLGISLFERIQGEDFSAISGLPLMALARLLRDEGFAIP